MKKIGIAVDDYKVEKYKQELTKLGFTNFTITKHLLNTSLIAVVVREVNVKKVAELCQRLEIEFKAKRN